MHFICMCVTRTVPFYFCLIINFLFHLLCVKRYVLVLIYLTSDCAFSHCMQFNVTVSVVVRVCCSVICLLVWVSSVNVFTFNMCLPTRMWPRFPISFFLLICFRFKLGFWCCSSVIVCGSSISGSVRVRSLDISLSITKSLRSETKPKTTTLVSLSRNRK